MVNRILQTGCKGMGQVGQTLRFKAPARELEISWKDILSRSVTVPEALALRWDIQAAELHRVTAHYPMRINPYYLGLIENAGDPIYRQCVPDTQEITAEDGWEDPLQEEAGSPVPGLTHRYPDRVLFLVSGRCAVYCRFCNRKRKVGHPGMVSKDSIREGLSYIQGHRGIRDVLLSGGDPFLLDDEELCQILSQLRAIPHIEIIRIGTRVPCALPHRITPTLVGMLRQFHPLYVHTHFNHPREITPQSSLACTRLADGGIPVGCQTVLLRGVNDDSLTLRKLMQKLLTIRVRPYYLFQADMAKGTSHFWTPLQKGLDILRELQGHTSGLCLPHFAIDLPGGGGKVLMLPESIVRKERERVLVRTYQGKLFWYPVGDTTQ
jgi:lysine 2,3-aminomutase